jgi:hypothetical protein
MGARRLMRALSLWFPPHSGVIWTAVFGKRRWAQEERELAQWSLTQGPGGAHVYFVLLSRAHLKKLGMPPLKQGTDFDKLIVRTIGDDVNLAAGPPPDELNEIAHTVYHSRLVLAGSRLAQGPYGDLFYRVLAGYGVALDWIGTHKHGAQPSFDEHQRVEPPIVSDFLDRAGTRFAGMLRGQDADSADGHAGLVATLQSLAAELGHEPPLIAALVGKSPAAARIHRPVPDWAGSFSYDDFMDATGDEKLSHELAEADPV